MGTAEETLPFFTQFFQFEARYDDMPTFSFFVYAMAIVTGYLALSVPVSIFCIFRPIDVAPRLILMLCDTLTLALATGGGSVVAGFIVVALLILLVLVSAIALKRR